MPSRPSRQERIQKDLDEILGQMAILAKALLIRNGEFFPFGATIGKRGKFSLITPVPEGELPSAQDVIDSVFMEIMSSHDSVRACGIAAMAATASNEDAVRIELEHVEGSSLVISLPYTRGDFGSFSYGEMEAQRMGRRIWPAGALPRPRTSKKKAAKAAPKARAAKKAAPKKRAAPRSAGKGRSSAKAAPKSRSSARERAKPASATKARAPRESRSTNNGTEPAPKVLETQGVLI